MKILFVTPPPYLPNRLHRIRAFELLRILAKKHEVHLLSVITKKDGIKDFKEIKKEVKSSTVIKFSKFKAFKNCLLSPTLPLEVSYCNFEEVSKKIKHIVRKEKIDVVYLKRLRSAIYFSDWEVPVVLDSTDAMSLFYKRMYSNTSFPKNIYYFLEGAKYKKFEKDTAGKIKSWIVCSENDADYLKKIMNVNTNVVPNPVDTGYFKFSPIRPKGDVLLLRGLMDKQVNIDAAIYFVSRIFPLIKRKIPKAKLRIVGPFPTRVVRKLEDRKNIFVEGFVNDMRQCLESSTISVCPIRIGTGTRHKILQSWAVGRPVVSTSIGAEGLNYKAGENIEIANSSEEFAKKVVILLKDNERYKKLSLAGRKLVQKEYSLGVVANKLDQVLEHAKNQKRIKKQ